MNDDPTKWNNELMADVVRSIASMADNDNLTPNRYYWGGVADILMLAADRIHEDPHMYDPVVLTRKKHRPNPEQREPEA